MPEKAWKKWRISAQNLLGHELIGLEALVKNSYDESKIGLQGRIVMETRNTLTLETSRGEKVLPKKEVVLAISLPEGIVEVEGKKIIGRPEDRTKMLAKAMGKRESR